MKNRKINLLALLLVSALVSACAATETSRSTGQVIDDSAIAAQVKAKLLADTVTDGFDIDVEVDRANVQLNGFVESDTQREHAEELALSVDGVQSVNNNLEISEGTRQAGEYLDDKVIIGKVKAALADDPLANALEIDVEANRGIVSLGGHVDTEAERIAAETAARSVNGVKDVINNLAVR